HKITAEIEAGEEIRGWMILQKEVGRPVRQPPGRTCAEEGDIPRREIGSIGDQVEAANGNQSRKQRDKCESEARFVPGESVVGGSVRKHRATDKTYEDDA